jgi:hypothetical protein
VSAHLTIAETAFLAPAGVILGAMVSYFAVRNSAAANLEAQKETIRANREINEQNRKADEARELRERDAAMGRERRQYQRQTYERVVSDLTVITDTLQALRHPSLPPVPSQADFEEKAGSWAQVVDALIEHTRKTFRAASLDASVRVRNNLEVLNHLIPYVSMPSPSANMRWLEHSEGKLWLRSDPLDTDEETRRRYSSTVTILWVITRWTVSHIRYELRIDEAEPPALPYDVDNTYMWAPNPEVPSSD